MRYFLFAFLFIKSFTFASLTLDEKIGQLFVIPLTSKLPEESYQEGLALIEKYKIGSILLQKSNSLAQMDMVINLQKDRKIPLLMIQDAEWGLSMRLDDAIIFPKNMTLGAIQNKELIYLFGKEVGRQLKLVGVGLGLLPVVDVNSNSSNPIIGMRSFGDNPYEVATLGSLVIKGLQESLVYASAKHFPGHGDTYTDSHQELPFIGCDYQRLENLELIPFQKAIETDVKTIMMGHIKIGDIDSLPASLSVKFVKDILKEKLKFEGIVITDALNMKAITNNFSHQEAALFAYLAGNDLLLYGTHIEQDVLKIYREFIPNAFEAIKNAVLSGVISQQDLDARVEKIVKAKEKLGFLQKTSSLEELFPKSAYDLKRELYRSALTYISNGVKPETFENVIYLKDLNNNINENFGLSEEKLQKLHDNKDNISLIVIFGSPYVISLLPQDVNLLVAYEDNEDTQEAVKDFLNGTIEAKGKLPINVYYNQELQVIVDKVWQSECGSKISKLTHWNDQENFPSLGIGHFIWYKEGEKERYEETFPQFLAFAEEKNEKLPLWLKESQGAPWNCKEAFYKDFDSPKMKELRTFLFKTRHLQAEFILNRFKNVFSKVIDKVDDEKKQTLKNHFSSLAKEAKGAFALMDFVHFKGDGTSEKERYNDKGWGLLQVLEHMPKESSDPFKDFIFSAKEILKERVKNAPTEKNEERWLKGWIARIDSYLK